MIFSTWHDGTCENVNHWIKEMFSFVSQIDVNRTNEDCDFVFETLFGFKQSMKTVYVS